MRPGANIVVSGNQQHRQIRPPLADSSSQLGAAEPRHRIIRDQQVELLGFLGVEQVESGMAACHGNHGAADGETVEPVGEVYGVGRADQHERNKSDKRRERNRPQNRILKEVPDHQVGMKLVNHFYQFFTVFRLGK